MITLRNIFVTACLLLIPAMSFAQSSIDKIVESLENDKNVQNVMYSEQRDKSTKKVWKSSRIIKFSDSKIASKLISAFKKERENAISYKSNNTPENTVYELQFNDGKGFTAKYILLKEDKTNWMLSVGIIRNPRQNRKSHRMSYEDYDNSFGNEYETYLSLTSDNSNNESNDDDDCNEIVIATESDSGSTIITRRSPNSYEIKSKPKSKSQKSSKHSSSTRTITINRYL